MLLRGRSSSSFIALVDGSKVARAMVGRQRASKKL